MRQKSTVTNRALNWLEKKEQQWQGELDSLLSQKSIKNGLILEIEFLQNKKTSVPYAKFL